MKPNELVIGDWVRCGKRYMKVTQLAEDMDCDDIDPIPITPEILEKNGFVKESRENHGNNLKYCILTDGLWIDISGENFFEGKLEYVHQLQHALRLCGIEIEIVL